MHNCSRMAVEFISVSNEFVCPVCYEILKSPFLTSCCGNHFCEACIEITKTNKDQCPLCQANPIVGIIDKHFQRRINEMKVHCTRKKEGCSWVGPASALDKHCNETTGDCDYAIISCPFSCGECIIKVLMNQHVNEECKFRPYTCPYKCGYVSTYNDVVTSHSPKCPNHMFPCPNSCSEELFQCSHLEEHLLTCPCAVVPCPFSEMGCKAKMKHPLIEKHLETNLVQHQLMMCSTIEDLQLESEEIVHTSKQSEHWINGYKLMAEEVAKSNWTLYLSSLAVVATNTPIPVSPVILKLPDYESKVQSSKAIKGFHFLSMPFYSHDKGYKMHLCIYPNGTGDSKESNDHMSVTICLNKGEHDYQLRWPCYSSIRVAILNQIHDSDHYEKEIWSSHYAIPASSYGACLIRGRGLSKFISHDDISASTANHQYLVNDTLYMKVVVNMTVHEDEHSL